MAIYGNANLLNEGQKWREEISGDVGGKKDVVLPANFVSPANRSPLAIVTSRSVWRLEPPDLSQANVTNNCNQLFYGRNPLTSTAHGRSLFGGTIDFFHLQLNTPPSPAHTLCSYPAP